MKPSESLDLLLKLQLNNSVVMDKPWENGLGMKFVPVGRELMACVWETRGKDYDAYLRAEGKPPADLRKGPDHPVVFVSRTDAEDFASG